MKNPPHPLILSERFTRAVDYARQLHTETRKGTQIPYMAHLLGVAKEKGITEDEITVIQGIVMAVSGGRVRAQFNEVQKISSDKKTNIRDCI